MVTTAATNGTRPFKGNIDEAYYDSWTIATTAGVLSDINWNEIVSKTLTKILGNLELLCVTLLTSDRLLLSIWAHQV